MLIAERVEQANGVISIFEPSVKLTVQNNRLYFNHRDYKAPANLRSDHRWFENDKIHHMISGTTENFICQLVNWVKDNPRLPLRCLEYWNSLGIDKQGNTTFFLNRWGYEDTSKVCCVTCKVYPIQSIDWYAFDGVVGPCCRKRECYQPQNTKIVIVEARAC